MPLADELISDVTAQNLRAARDTAPAFNGVESARAEFELLAEA
ncbi:hypothetical protein [Agromyces bauzanensis]